MEYIVRFAQTHETFRRPELEALATLWNIELKIVTYSEDSPFCVVRLPSDDVARKLVSRAILVDSVYELWGSGPNYEALHADVKAKSQGKWDKYTTTSFRFNVHGYQCKLTNKEQRPIIESFSYLPFDGPIKMKDADVQFWVFEEYEMYAPSPKFLYFSRFIGPGGRDTVLKYDLKKRRYISTTSMDAELALITANIALARPGGLFYDPFMGTGGFPIACAHFGAMTTGSDIDARSIRGKPNRNVLSNYAQYDLTDYWLDWFISDLTNTPLRISRFLDGIVCDPPYGVREGLKVLGRKDGGGTEAVYINGVAAHLQEGFIPPKRAYSFDAMLDDILDFAAQTLVDRGRLAIWMPTANEDIELAIPEHQCLKLVANCIQMFNKWSRRLLTYERLPDELVGELIPRTKRIVEGSNADELNNFRRKYFEGFKPSTPSEK
ncbi:tRNA guanosine-2'-O-methyltransferase [Trichodelitschia bisporula]|uniref:tRNA (guanine(10)-N(2))-methyltransferase n=1 Tax=Trichodelitschia bisporula TaxID=703511 RepID=A0A6G1HZA0_9PEZI|nr:tRNA guanosine-2'-O-methyltransferase [Trichodelitschia bisporula]